VGISSFVVLKVVEHSRSIGASPRRCFEKYVDAVIDLLIPGQSPGIKERLVDHYGKPELLFFGPDEGTADMMDWAACMTFHFTIPIES
jgi:NAD-specific glutamate dehydrogenase